ncbi:hypothetical protein BREU_0953 [Bifidobacterium reuteri DSM 23975]|uniref:Uncharacterized protein n=1 Tax=Bifidobacterium reuteri DSM 23975 TaxID=1437610 RepID=A0A087CR74_9BIFI|nr:hypothetical protein BREU_0953 [Bifidobacterium reuteri DSM 23975]
MGQSLHRGAKCGCRHDVDGVVEGTLRMVRLPSSRGWHGGIMITVRAARGRDYGVAGAGVVTMRAVCGCRDGAVGEDGVVMWTACGRSYGADGVIAVAAQVALRCVWRGCRHNAVGARVASRCGWRIVYGRTGMWTCRSRCIGMYATGTVGHTADVHAAADAPAYGCAAADASAGECTDMWQSAAPSNR